MLTNSTLSYLLTDGIVLPTLPVLSSTLRKKVAELDKGNVQGNGKDVVFPLAASMPLRDQFKEVDG